MTSRKGPKRRVVHWYTDVTGVRRQELSCGHRLPCVSEDGKDHTQETLRNCIHCYISSARRPVTAPAGQPARSEGEPDECRCGPGQECDECRLDEMSETEKQSRTDAARPWIE